MRKKEKIGHRFKNFLVDTLKIRFFYRLRPFFSTVLAESVKKVFTCILVKLCDFSSKKKSLQQKFQKTVTMITNLQVGH